jgi:hypothetical protein
MGRYGVVVEALCFRLRVVTEENLLTPLGESLAEFNKDNGLKIEELGVLGETAYASVISADPDFLCLDEEETIKALQEFMDKKGWTFVGLFSSAQQNLYR